MRNSGLNDAIAAAGGVGALARKVGIAQPSVANWTRVPAERVAAVETATGIDRAILRPDLYGHAVADDVDAERAREYALLTSLLAQAPDADLLRRLSALEGDDTPLGQAHVALAEGARRVPADHVEREFFDLFIGVGRGELMPYGSFYLTGFLHERPLARLRGFLATFGIERNEGHPEPEDNIAMLCETMVGLISGRFNAPAGSDRELFEKHIAPWAGRFFADLEKSERADFYRQVGRLGRVFFEIEAEAFAQPT